ncbi:MAG: translesion DNA synthesis-associated protein ImuA [Pseudomonadota bacterium]|nr:MAG: translesion DNA synthesis-associated protein ImuA [Pseudomonadota bacterium]
MPAPDQSSTPSLDVLLTTRSDLWRGRKRPAVNTLPTGQAWLDRQLPGGGWPCSRLTELISTHPGAGAFGLLLPALARQTRSGRPVVLVAPPLLPCPQTLACAGLDLSRLIVIRRADQTLWASEQCLKSGLCGAVVAWPAPAAATPTALRRLQLAARSGDAPLFVCYRPEPQLSASSAVLRLMVRPGPVITIMHAAGTAPTGELRPAADNVVTLAGHRPQR